MGEHLNQLGSQPSLTGDRRKGSFDQPEGVVLLQGPPALPPQDRGRVDQQDLLDDRIRGDPDPFQAAGLQRGRRAGRAGGGRDGAPPDVGFQCFKHRLEQGVLPLEVMVERTPAGAGLLQDGVDRRRLVSALGEQRGGHREQVLAGCRSARDVLVDPVRHAAQNSFDKPTVGLKS